MESVRTVRAYLDESLAPFIRAFVARCTATNQSQLTDDAHCTHDTKREADAP